MKTAITRVIMALGLAAIMAGPALGQSTAQNAPQNTPPPPPPATPCQDDPAFSQWDFWVGEWKVYSNDEARTFAGTNSIKKHYANCLITETWESATGGGGFSINYYNPVRRQWRQVWVANGYSIDYTGGLNDKGQMVLEGEIDSYATNNSTRFRGIWTPEAGGDVIQKFETHDAATDTWSIWFEGRYVRQQPGDE